MVPPILPMFEIVKVPPDNSAEMVKAEGRVAEVRRALEQPGLVRVKFGDGDE